MSDENVRDLFEIALDEANHRLAGQLQNAMVIQLRELQKRYPQRALRFSDIMGSVTIQIEMRTKAAHTTEADGKHWMATTWAPTLTYGVKTFEPYDELISWYCEQSDRIKVGIDDIEIKPTEVLRKL